MKGILRSIRTAFITVIFLYLLSWMINYLSQPEAIQTASEPVATSIQNILTDPLDFNQLLVELKGDVVFSAKIPVDYYLLNDGTGIILVYPQTDLNPLPSVGEKKLIVGKLKQTGVVGPLHIISIEEVL